MSLESVLCCNYRSLRRADHSSRGVLPSVVFLSVISKPQQGGRLGSQGLPGHEETSWDTHKAVTDKEEKLETLPLPGRNPSV